MIELTALELVALRIMVEGAVSRLSDPKDSVGAVLGEILRKLNTGRPGEVRVVADLADPEPPALRKQPPARCQ